MLTITQSAKIRPIWLPCTWMQPLFSAQIPLRLLLHTVSRPCGKVCWSMSSTVDQLWWTSFSFFLFGCFFNFLEKMAPIESRCVCVQGCQIFRGTTYQNFEKMHQISLKYTKWPHTTPNSHNIDQMDIQCTNNYHSETI
jgi:hypothetical protein